MSSAFKLAAPAFPEAPEFPLGYADFCAEPNINFQLNRCFNGLGESARSDLSAVGAKIRTFTEYKREMLALAARTLADGRKLHAAYYLRFAEFFMAPADSDKERVYNEFTQLFSDVYPQLAGCRSGVPYEGKQLPLIHLRPAGVPKDTILLHGGFDSFLEELYPYLFAIRDLGYEVYAFEGPGQGAALKHQQLTFIHDWERPVAAVLDHCRLQDVTLVGVSLGGYLALRAAAYEARIKRVVAFDVCYDFFDAVLGKLPLAARLVVRAAVHLGARDVVNKIARKRMRQDALARWGVTHGMHVFGVATPFDFLQNAMRLSMRGHSARVRQDVLVMAGKDDHLVPFTMFARQIRALTRARSVTGRIFTAAEHASQHCQVGNLKLALKVIDLWLQQFAP